MSLRRIPLALTATMVTVLLVTSWLRTNAAPEPAAPAHVYALRGAKVYTLAGPPVENGTVVIRDGKIAAVGQTVDVPSDAEVIEVKGLEV